MGASSSKDKHQTLKIGKSKYKVISVRSSYGGISELIVCHTKTKQQYLLKKILIIGGSNTINYLSGVDILSRLPSHPNIVQYIASSFIVHPNKPIEFALLTENTYSSLTLSYLMQIKLLNDFNSKLMAFHDICSAIHHCHKHNIAHLSIHPMNILRQNLIITHDDKIKYIYKITKFDHNINKNSIFIAPELSNETQYADGKQKADIWSLGVLLLYLLYDGILPIWYRFIPEPDCTMFEDCYALDFIKTNMIHYNPHKRISIGDTLKFIETANTDIMLPSNTHKNGTQNNRDTQNKTYASTDYSYIKYWCCATCKQLNNLKDTLCTYDMKCFRCDALYQIKSDIILIEEDMNDPLITTWKCPQCTVFNENNEMQCRVCETHQPKPMNQPKPKDEEKDNALLNEVYIGPYFTYLVCGYLREILDLDETILAELFSIFVLKYYKHRIFWNLYSSEGFIYDFDEKELVKIGDGWSNAYFIETVGDRKGRYLCDYVWTLQIKYVDPTKVDIKNKCVPCWIGLIEGGRSTRTSIFCSSKVGYGVGYNGDKMHDDITKPFGEAFQVNDIIKVKLKCTRAYYELRYEVNGEEIGRSNTMNDDPVAYRLPKDKIYQLVIALKDSNYKIKCITFQTY